MMRPVFVAAFALLLAACGKQESATETTPVAAPAGSEKPAPVTPTVEGRFAGEIKAEDFAARLKKLSSDQFEGREPGTIGERVTTNYIKDQFERIGLKPGNNGNWFQTVPMVKTELIDPASVRIEVTGSTGTQTFGIGADAVLNTLNGSMDVSIKDSDIVFAGYGVNAPDWNDY
ncbi:MAG: aminopeptidase, partial [Xanthomonadales bacterium]|nr:aminopeptidase [Xanthomonadales bacterium]